MISINPVRGDLKVKNRKDHKILSNSCTINMIKAILTGCRLKPLRQMRNNAMPIRINKTVQAGPNNQSGGLKLGFLSDAYQVGIERLVKIDPIKPAARQIMILTTSFKISIPFIV
jgi:hypothetical protein